MTNASNFHLMTKGTFSKCDLPKTAPDYVSLDKFGNVSSKYWYTAEGVVRQSNHWGRVASCIWTLKGFSTTINDCEVSKNELVAYISFADLNNSTNKFQVIVDKQAKVIAKEVEKLTAILERTPTFRDGMATEKGIEANDKFKDELKKLFNL